MVSTLPAGSTGSTASAAPPQPATLPALALPHGQTAHLIAALLPWLAQGRRCYCLDGGNCFSPYALATEARRQKLNPKPLLERVLISRAYTCHQLLEAVSSMLAPLADRPQPPLALILGLDRLFLDGDISLAERRRVFERVVARAARLAHRGLPLLATVTNAERGMQSAEYKPFYSQLRLLTSAFTIPNADLRIPQFLAENVEYGAEDKLLGARTSRPLAPPSANSLLDMRSSSKLDGPLDIGHLTLDHPQSEIRNPQSAIARL